MTNNDNPGNSYRAGTIHIKDVTTNDILKSFTVYQDGACTFTLSSNSQQHSSNFESSSFTVTTAGSGCSWTAIGTPADWIKNVTKNGNTVNYDVDSNLFTVPREGTISIKDQNLEIVEIFRVIQSAACTITLNPISRTHSAEPETAVITISATNEDCQWEVDIIDAPDWIEFDPRTLTGTDDGTIQYGVKRNDTGVDRSPATFTVGGQAYTINQDAEETFPGVSVDESLYILYGGSPNIIYYDLGDTTPVEQILMDRNNITSKFPSSFTFDPDDHFFYVAEKTNHEVYKVSTTGIKLETFADDNNDDLSDPVAVEVGPDGRLYVLNKGANGTQHSLMSFNTETGGKLTILTNTDTPFDSSPVDIAFDSGQNLYIAQDFTNNAIIKLQYPYNSNVPVLFKSSTDVGAPKRIECDSNDNMYVLPLTGKTIRRFKSDGTDFPSTGNTGSLFYTNSSPIMVDMKFDSTGNFLYVADKIGDKIMKFSTSGLLETYPTDFGDPEVIAVGQLSPLLSENNPPNAVNDVITIEEDASLIGFDVIENDTDDFGVKNLQSAGTTGDGLVSYNTNTGTVDFIPNDNFNGIASFPYTLSDGIQTENANVNITVSPIPDFPNASSNPYDAGQIDEDSDFIDINIIVEVITDPDLPNDSHRIISADTTSAEQGQIVISGDEQSVSYKPFANYNNSAGFDTFNYSVEDSAGLAFSGSVKIKVNPINDVPVANDDPNPSTNENSSAVIDVLANDNDIEDDNLTVHSIDTTNTAGTVINNNVNVTFTPAADFDGTTTFKYRAQDNNGGVSNWATVTVTVIADPPALSLTIAANSIPEDAGSAATTATVSRNTDTTDALVVNLNSSDSSEAMVPPSVTIPIGQSTSAPFNISAINDAVDDGTQTVTITASATGHPDDTDTLDVTDNDTRGMTVTVADNLSSETGAKALFNVVLNSEPTTTVIITVSSNDNSEGIVSLGSTRTFTTTNWNSPKLVEVTGQNDAVDDGDINYTVSLSASGGDYSGITSSASLTNVDDDTAGLAIAVSDSQTNESGDEAHLTVALSSEPTANVTVAVLSNDSSEGMVTLGSTLTFTTTNWSSPKSAEITGQNDEVDDGDVNYTVSLSASGGGYSGITSSASLTNVDNDTAGLIITVSDSQTTESGEKAHLTVVLSSEPTETVTVTVSSNDSSEGVVTLGSTLTFTTSNWSNAKPVEVTGQDDTICDENVIYSVSVSASGGDYSGITGSAQLTNINDEIAGLTIVVSDNETDESGNKAHLTVKLDNEPMTTVTLTVLSNDSTEGVVTLGSTLTFTPTTWDIAQPVEVTGQDDVLEDGDINYAISINVSGGMYDGVTGSVSLINEDDEIVFDRILQNITVAIGDNESWSAVNTITAAGNSTFFAIVGNGSDGGNAVFTAGSRIDLKPGFQAQTGSSFNASIQ